MSHSHALGIVSSELKWPQINILTTQTYPTIIIPLCAGLTLEGSKEKILGRALKLLKRIWIWIVYWLNNTRHEIILGQRDWELQSIILTRGVYLVMLFRTFSGQDTFLRDIARDVNCQSRIYGFQKIQRFLVFTGPFLGDVWQRTSKQASITCA